MSSSTPSTADIPIALPEPGQTYAQDNEWCLARIDDEWREIRFHDYDELFAVEGLYERLFYDVLKCASPATVCGLLEDELSEAGITPEDLRVLDLGAGNGIMGEELAQLGVDSVVGIDIIPEAAEAAERDRPDVYDDYHVVDLTRLAPPVRDDLAEHGFNCLTCVAALGFGDIPPKAFQEAYNIKEDFLAPDDPSGFSRLIARGISEGLLDVRVRERYRHRLSTAGEPLHYLAVIGTKGEDIPEEMVP